MRGGCLVPKFIGNTIRGSLDLHEHESPEELMSLSYSQARLLPPADVYYRLNTSDRGSRGSLAKRWHDWYSTVSAILACSDSTRKMRTGALLVRQREFELSPLGTLVRLLAPLGAALALEAKGLLDGIPNDQYDSTVSVGVDLLLEAGYPVEDSPVTESYRQGARTLVVSAIHWRRSVYPGGPIVRTRHPENWA
jgi:hypothetical protein